MTPQFAYDYHNHFITVRQSLLHKNGIVYLLIHSVTCLLQEIIKIRLSVFFVLFFFHPYQYLRPHKANRTLDNKLTSMNKDWCQLTQHDNV